MDSLTNLSILIAYSYFVSDDFQEKPLIERLSSIFNYKQLVLGISYITINYVKRNHNFECFCDYKYLEDNCEHKLQF